MWRRSLFLLIAVFYGGSMRVAAQEAHPPQATEQARPTHGIIRKPQPKLAEPPKAPTTETAKPAEPVKTEPVKAAPAASTEAVAAAIANAVRSLEEKEKKKPESAHPQPARTVRPAARPVPQRRYSVSWPSQRFAVQWSAPEEDRITLSWDELEP